MKQDRIRRATVWLMSAFAMMIMPLLNSCNSEELLTKTAAEENAEWHFSIDADRSGGVETRALTEKENMLQSSWNPQNDYIYVYNKSKSSLQVNNYLKPDKEGVSASLEGTFENGKYEVGDELMLMLRFSTTYSAFDYYNQSGTMEEIAKSKDFAMAEVTVTEVDGTNVKTTRAKFRNLQSIFKVNFVHGDKPLNVKMVKVTKGDGKLCRRYCPYSDSPVYNSEGPVFVYVSPASSEVWMSLRSEFSKDDTYTFTVTDENNVEYVGVKNKGFEIGKFYTTTIPVRVPFDSKNNPLTVEAVEAGSITIDNPMGLTIQYAKNDGDKQSSHANPIEISVDAHDRVALYGDNKRYADGIYINSNITHIDFTSYCYVYGNIMSLIQSSGFETLTTLDMDFNFPSLFKDNEHLLSHSDKELVLPATSVPKRAYALMFSGCKKMTIAPELPATTVGENSYSQMFWKCESLVTPPSVLPATTVGVGSYREMFYGCISLERAPELMATKLTEECCQAMYKNCTKLVTVPNLHATELDYQSCWSMFESCSALKKAPALPATKMTRQCYDSMFRRCKSLESVPDITVSQFSTDCFYNMFCNCTSLEVSPVLRVEGTPTMQLGCCKSMFVGCSKLKKVTCYFTPCQVNYYDGPEWTTTGWMVGVSSTGTFIKKKGTEWPSGTQGIPEGWTVKEVE